VTNVGVSQRHQTMTVLVLILVVVRHFQYMPQLQYPGDEMMYPAVPSIQVKGERNIAGYRYGNITNYQAHPSCDAYSSV